MADSTKSGGWVDDKAVIIGVLAPDLVTVNELITEAAQYFIEEKLKYQILYAPNCSAPTEKGMLEQAKKIKAAGTSVILNVSKEHIELDATIKPEIASELADLYELLKANHKILSKKLCHEVADLVLPITEPGLDFEVGALNQLPYSQPSTEAYSIIKSRPTNELDCLANTLFRSADLPYAIVESSLQDIDYEDKSFALIKAYKQDKAGPMLLIQAYDSYQNISPLKGIATVNVQNVSPKLGYDVPQSVIDSGVEDIFEDCFDASYKVFNLLYDQPVLAQQACLQGHRVNAIIRISVKPTRLKYIQSKNTALYKKIENIITQKYPLLYESLSTL